MKNNHVRYTGKRQLVETELIEAVLNKRRPHSGDFLRLGLGVQSEPNIPAEFCTRMQAGCFPWGSL